MNDLSKYNCTRTAEGPKDSVLLCMYHCGLGDDMHALPTVSRMVRDGLRVTVNCKPFHVPIWKGIGCVTTSLPEPFGLTWYEENEAEYGRIVSLFSWGGWECHETGGHRAGTMDEFAEIVRHPLPESFSWIETLNPNYIPSEPYILFNPHSVEVWRTLPQSVADRIASELRQTGTPVRILRPDECATWHGLLDLIYNAAIVVTVEGGVSNIAGALNKNLLCLTGMTEIESTVGQYRRYIPDLHYEVLEGFQPTGCSMPCYRQPNRGFKNDKCLGSFDKPLCLNNINIARVTELLQQFLTTH